jgi:hypothetical protein
MSKTVLPNSAAGQSCRYTLAIWKKLICFLDPRQLELSTLDKTMLQDVLSKKW